MFLYNNLPLFRPPAENQKIIRANYCTKTLNYWLSVFVQQFALFRAPVENRKIMWSKFLEHPITGESFSLLAFPLR